MNRKEPQDENHQVSEQKKNKKLGKSKTVPAANIYIYSNWAI